MENRSVRVALTRALDAPGNGAAVVRVHLSADLFQLDLSLAGFVLSGKAVNSSEVAVLALPHKAVPSEENLISEVEDRRPVAAELLGGGSFGQAVDVILHDSES